MARNRLVCARRSAPALCVAVFVMTMIVVISGPAPASGADYWHTCRPPSSLPIGTLRAHSVACGKARRIIGGFYAKAQAAGPDVIVDGFHCVAIVGGVSCRHGARRIRLEGSSERFELHRRAAARSESCPDVRGGVLKVRRGPGSPYAVVKFREGAWKVWTAH